MCTAVAEKFDPARGCEEDESAYDCIRPYFGKELVLQNVTLV